MSLEELFDARAPDSGTRRRPIRPACPLPEPCSARPRAVCARPARRLVIPAVSVIPASSSASVGGGGPRSASASSLVPRRTRTNSLTLSRSTFPPRHRPTGAMRVRENGVRRSRSSSESSPARRPEARRPRERAAERTCPGSACDCLEARRGEVRRPRRGCGLPRERGSGHGNRCSGGGRRRAIR